MDEEKRLTGVGDGLPSRMLSPSGGVVGRCRIPDWMNFSTGNPRVYAQFNRPAICGKAVHTHEFYELVIVRSGHGLHVTRDGVTMLRPKEAFLVKPTHTHCYRSSASLEVLSIFLGGEHLHGCSFVDKHFVERLYSGIHLSSRQVSLIEAIAMEMQSEQTNKFPGWEEAMKACFVRMWLVLQRASKQERAVGRANDRLFHVMDYIAHHSGENISASSVAEACGLNIRSLERLFAGTVGVSPASYLVDQRLRHAAELLCAQVEWELEKIASSCGFSDCSYFSRLFSRKYGISPRNYRKQFLAMCATEHAENAACPA